MPSPAASTASIRTVLRRFRRNRRGSAAVEFALVAPVFFALLFAIIETAIVFFAVEILIIYCVVKFRRRKDSPEPVAVHGNAPLEIGWTIGASRWCQTADI